MPKFLKVVKDRTVERKEVLNNLRKKAVRLKRIWLCIWGLVL